jgi:hypothetical protein
MAVLLVMSAARAGDWQSEVQKRIANEEYRITWQKDRFHAANRAQNLRAYFDKNGVMVQRRTATGSGWKLGMRLVAVGRTGQMQAVTKTEPILGRCVKGSGPGALKGCMRRLEYYHIKLLTIEWYVNIRAGLEQGFELWAPPPGEGELRLVQEITGAELQKAGNAVKLTPPGSRPLDFKGIKARDHTGKPLTVRLEVEDGKMVTVVDDSKASYPIYVE